MTFVIQGLASGCLTTEGPEPPSVLPVGRFWRTSEAATAALAVCVDVEILPAAPRTSLHGSLLMRWQSVAAPDCACKSSLVDFESLARSCDGIFIRWGPSLAACLIPPTRLDLL